MNLINQLNVEQNQSLSSIQIESLKILSMNMLQLKDYLIEEYNINPILEYKEKEDKNIKIDSLFDDLYISSRSKQDDNNKESFDIENKSNKDYIYNIILDQIDFSQFNKKEEKIIKFLIDNLDDKGYFTLSVFDIVKILNVKEKEVVKLLSYLKTLSPYGIFSSSFEESLVVQLKLSNKLNDDIEKLVMNHLEDLASEKFGKIQKSINISYKDILNYKKILSTLNPYPLWGVCIDMKENYVEPDSIFLKEDNKWKIIINDKFIKNYSLNNHYINMMKNTEDVNLKRYLKGNLIKVNIIMDNILKRRNTLLKINKEILKCQKEYFFGKRDTFKTMSFTYIANKLDVSPSTVTRALKDKYVATPRGIIKYSDMFKQNNIDNSLKDFSRESIKNEIINIVSQEDKTNPYTDDDIGLILNRQGIKISRRTIAKYRNEIGISSLYERKVYK